VVCSGAANDSKADIASAQRRERSIRRSVEGKVARRERGRQDLLHDGRGFVVSRDRDLPDGHAEARKHTR